MQRLLSLIHRAEAVSILLAVSGAHAGDAPRATAPAWELKDVNGKTVRLADYKGKVVILDFWATWCAQCRKEIPEFVALQRKYSANGLVIIGVALEDEADTVRELITAQGINYPVVLGGPLIAANYGNIQSIPTTFIIDRAGKIVAVHEGFADIGQFEADLKPLL